MVDNAINVGTMTNGRDSRSRGILGFVWHHAWLALEERSLRKETTVLRPAEVLLEDGSVWRLVRRDGVDWFLFHPERGHHQVTSADVQALPTKWDFKS